MNFNSYQAKALNTAIYPNRGHDILYPTLGLASEAGEVAGIVKKVIRDNGGVVDDATGAVLKKELGDVLWYIAAVCSEADLSLEDVAEANIAKLKGRQERGELGGSGDDR